MKEIRVTMLEKFRRFRDNVSESYDTEQSVVDAISGQFTGNDLTQIGTAFHWLVEDKDDVLPHIFTDKVIDDVRCNFGVVFNSVQINCAINHSLSLRPFVAEVRSRKVYSTAFGDIYITGCTDVLQGNTLRDTKTKFTPPLMQDYYYSYQWRIYLSIFKLDRFLYDVFEFTSHDGKDVSKSEIIQHDPFECVRYENMETDIHILINDFVAWVNYRDLWHYLQDV